MKRNKKGGDIVSSVISKIPIEFHLRDTSLKKYSFCGPNTNLKERLNPDGTPKEWSKPINKVDEICMNHDKNYKRADEGLTTRHEADKQMLEELNKLENKKLNWNEFLAKYFTKAIIGSKYKLGLGLEEAEELHKPIRHKFKRRRVMVYNIDDIWSADLTNAFQSIAKDNKGYKYMLNIIDLFSKNAYSIPLKSKSADEVIEAFNRLFLSGKKPNKLWTDRGSEFTNNKFKHFLKSNNIELYHVYNEGKACVIERFNRTLGEMIQKHLTSSQSSKYVDILQKLIDEYNSKTHSTIKMSPHDAQLLENKDKVLEAFIDKPNNDKPKFDIGDRVRIYRYKSTFEKGYKPNWTKEIFVVSKIKRTNPLTYEIDDLNGEPILGAFYSQELLKTKF